MIAPTIITTPKTATSKADRVAAVRGSYWLPTQQKWIQSKSRKKILVKTRRYGGSYAEAYTAARNTAMAGNKYDAWVSSRDLLAARLFLEDAKKHSLILDKGARDMGEVVITNPDKDFKAFQLSFSNGKSVNSLSSNPDALAGKQGRFTKDEAALDKDLYLWYRIVQPAIMRGGSISLISTQRGVANFFNRLVVEIEEKGNPKKFELFRITIEDAIKEGLWIKIQDDLPDDEERKQWTEDEFLQSLRDEMPDEASFLQEYMCVPEDDASSFLTWEMIIACSNAVRLPRWQRDSGPFFVGFDVGRKKDLSVISVFKQLGTQLIEVDEIIMSKTSFSEQRRRLWEILRMPTVSRCCIDAGGIGMQLAEETVAEFGEFKIHPVMFTVQSKQELAYPMKAMFEDRTISIIDDRLSHADLRSIKTDTTSSGAVIFVVEAGSTDGHADRFWSKALAVHASKTLTDPGVFGRFKHLQRGSSSEDNASRRSLRSVRTYD